MSITEERKNEVESKMAQVLGSEVTVREWCGNTSILMASLLKGNGDKPADLEAQIALNLFFIEVIKKVYGVDQEIMDLEVSKCYRIMEQMVAKIKPPQIPPHAQEGMNPVGDMIGKMLGGIAAGNMPRVMPQANTTDIVDPIEECEEVDFIDEGISELTADDLDDE